MNRKPIFALGIAGILLMFLLGQGWGQLPPGNDISGGTNGTNTGGGSSALGSNPTAGDNTAYGWAALILTKQGSENSAFGSGSLHDNFTGSRNTAVGRDALFRNSTGSDNVGVGSGALFNLKQGSENIALGRSAGALLINGSGNIYLGYEDLPRGFYDEHNTMRLGEFQKRTFIAGIQGIVLTNADNVVIDPATGQLGVTPSSTRYKRDIEPMDTRSRGLFELRPVTFTYKQDLNGRRQYGLIAEEVAKVYPELVSRDAKGEVESVRYQELTPMILNELQDQQRQLKEQAQQLSGLKAENEQLRALVRKHEQLSSTLSERLDRLESAAHFATSANR
jgi:Chaperone of endosialidase